jgi:hypothetical protein
VIGDVSPVGDAFVEYGGQHAEPRANQPPRRRAQPADPQPHSSYDGPNGLERHSRIGARPQRSPRPRHHTSAPTADMRLDLPDHYAAHSGGPVHRRPRPDSSRIGRSWAGASGSRRTDRPRSAQRRVPYLSSPVLSPAFGGTSPGGITIRDTVWRGSCNLGSAGRGVGTCAACSRGRRAHSVRSHPLVPRGRGAPTSPPLPDRSRSRCP